MDALLTGLALRERAASLAGRDERLARALAAAERAHANEKRDGGTPYVEHPIRVALSVAEEAGLDDPEALCAALLHDVLEDSEITRADLARELGPAVADLVARLTQEGDAGAYVARIRAAPDARAEAVKLADRLDNFRSIPLGGKAKKKIQYLAETERFYVPWSPRTEAARVLHRLLVRQWRSLAPTP
jgi:(p)ppGpp synthase/HD superfamily hydrolase